MEVRTEQVTPKIKGEWGESKRVCVRAWRELSMRCMFSSSSPSLLLQPARLWNEAALSETAPARVPAHCVPGPFDAGVSADPGRAAPWLCSHGRNVRRPLVSPWLQRNPRKEFLCHLPHAHLIPPARQGKHMTYFTYFADFLPVCTYMHSFPADI